LESSFTDQTNFKLSENNSFKIENTVDKTVEVYLSIPSEKQEKESAIKLTHVLEHRCSVPTKIETT
jgi:hypothetical protein